MKFQAILLFASLLFIKASCNEDVPVDTPEAGFSITGYQTPAPATINFVNTSRNASSYLWNFGDGTTSTEHSPRHVYNFPGSFELRLKVTGANGSDSICKLVSIESPVTPSQSSFSYFLDKCAGYPVGAAFRTLNPASQNTVWDFGNGVINTNRDPIIQFALPGDYTIKYSSEINNRRDTVVRVIRIQ